MAQKNFVKIRRLLANDGLLISCVILVLSCTAMAQQGKGGAAKTGLTGRYEGTAKNKAEDVITVTIDLTDKDGTLSGAIHSSHGDFSITGGSREGEAVTIQFDAGGSTGTISARVKDGILVGTWTAGDDGGALEVKKAAEPEGSAKGNL